MKMRIRRSETRMIRKNSFMEDNITRNENRISKKIKQFVSFDIIRITNKKTRLSLGIKLRTISGKSRRKT
jgi:hypothetical protein